MLRFTIADTGVGIPAEVQGQLFQSFTQGDSSTTRKYGGTGLGLVISKRLAEMMGGAIGIESELGRGSTFWFTVRLYVPAETSSPQVPKLSAPTSERSQCRGHLLIAEDNAINRKVLTTILGRLGYTTEIAINGSEALEKIQQHSYDAILMDCQMPVMDGFQATQAIRTLAT